MGGVGRVGNAFVLVLAVTSCGGSGKSSTVPSAPSSPFVPNSPGIDLTVSAGNAELGGDFAHLTPSVSYSACRSLQNVSGTTVIITYEMEMLGEDGSVYPTTILSNAGLTLGPLEGFFGCGQPQAYDFNLTHPPARTYRLRVRYQTLQGVTGAVEGAAAMRALLQPLPPRLIVNEFRTRGPNGPEDQFVELYNDSLAAHTVSINLIAAPNSNLSVEGTQLGSTRIGPQCHFLFAGRRYSGATRPDAVLARPLTDDGAIRLIPGFESYTQNDIVGMNGFQANFEGTPLPPFGDANTDRSYVRIGPDTNDNSRDFTMRGPSTPQNSNDCGAR